MPAPLETTATLSVVGLGPGDPCLLAPLAARYLAEAEVLVGYRTYLDLLDPALLDGKEVVASAMTREIERAGAAVDAAASGRPTCLVSGGDAGVYGMAGLALEVLEARGLLDAVECRVAPGIPALCAAAALLGAPLVHDFASVSLSDLLTPWEVIERRLELAAQADFVIVLYNPASKRRDWQLARALEIVGSVRAPETPVGFVRNAYRDGQEVRVARLADCNPAWADMLSIVVLGNSATRLVEATAGPRMLTPRGYGDKYGAEALEQGSTRVHKAGQGR